MISNWNKPKAERLKHAALDKQMMVCDTTFATHKTFLLQTGGQGIAQTSNFFLKRYFKP